MLSKGAVEPLECPVFLAKPGMDDGQVVRRDVASLCLFVQFAHHLPRQTSFARRGVSEPEEGCYFRVARRKLTRLSQLTNGFLVHPLLRISPSQIDVRKPEV